MSKFLLHVSQRCMCITQPIYAVFQDAPIQTNRWIQLHSLGLRFGAMFNLIVAILRFQSFNIRRVVCTFEYVPIQNARCEYACANFNGTRCTEERERERKKTCFVWNQVCAILCRTHLALFLFLKLQTVATKWIVFSCSVHWQMMQKRPRNLNEFLHDTV